MRRWLLLFAAGCSSSSNPPGDMPDREADVLIAASNDLVLLYRDGDGDWRRAPRVSNGFGFDLDSDHYAVAAVDVAHGQVESVFTTLDEQTDLVFQGVPEAALHTITVSFSGMGVNGGDLAIPTQQRFVPRQRPSFEIDVPQGAVTFAAARRDDSFIPDTLVLRRDVAIAGPTDIAIDFDAEGLRPTRMMLPSQISCDYTSTFSFGATTIGLASGRRNIVMPHPDQWLAGDRLTVFRFCGTGQLIDELVSPDQVLPPVELPPPLGPASIDVSPDRYHFSFTTSEGPVRYELVVAGAPCDTLTLIDFANGNDCRQRWTTRVSEGWTLVSGTELDTISRSELEALGVWNDALHLPTPLAWAAFAIRGGVDHRTRTFTAEILQ